MTSLVYKISRKDDVDACMCYIGSTNNFNSRKASHKYQSKTRPHLKLYTAINDSGGWEKWEFEVLEILKSEEAEANTDNSSLKKLERMWIEKINPCLNKNSPIGRDCIHGIRNTTCKICEGSEICEHGKRKSICAECNGASICIHKRQKRKCKDCHGTGICNHNKRKERCVICEPEKYKLFLEQCRIYNKKRSKTNVIVPA